jgi:type VI secretion system protein VasD
MDKTRSCNANCPAPAAPSAGQPVETRTATRRIWLVAFALGLVSSLSACGMFSPPPPPPPKPPPPPPPPPKLAISIVAAAQLNPDASARPSPVVVRLYELKSATQFGGAGFMLLFDQDRSALAGDIVVREEFVMRPGDTKVVDKLLSPETQAIGVMAAFRDLERAQWRGVVALTPGKDNTVVIDLADVFVKMSQSAK